MENNAIGNRLKELCNEKNISISELGERIGMPARSIYRIVYGATHNPGIYTMMTICKGLDVSMDEFFGTDAFKEFRK